MFLLCIIEGNDPGRWVLARFYRPGDGGFELFYAQGWGIRQSRKFPGRGSSGLELTHTLISEDTIDD